MRTHRQARMVLAGSRARVYDIDLVELSGTNPARFLVNFRYGWQGAALEEGTRTPDPLSQDAATRVFESLVVARKNQGYQLVDESTPAPKVPALAVVSPGANPRDEILAARLRGLDGLSDIKAASLIRRIGELRLKALAAPIVAAAQALRREGTRIVAMRSLPYTLHRTDDGSGSAGAALTELAACADRPAAETAAMLVGVRQSNATPDWDTAPLVLRAAATLPDVSARDAATLAYFQAATAATNRPSGPLGPTAEAASTAASALRALYVRGTHDGVARSMALAALAAAPLKPPLFQAIRRIWQVAQATGDAHVFALLLARFDDERSTIQIYNWGVKKRQAYVGGKLVSLHEEAAKPAARLAYAEPTRAFLRRRGWRTLRRLGQAGDPAYVALAEAVLLTLDDATTKPVPPRNAFYYDKQTRARRVVTRHYPLYPDRFAAHHILHGARTRLTPSPRSLRWRYGQIPDAKPTSREERFPDLWDARPDILWNLARTSKAALVVGFAARALIENTDFVDQIASSEISALLLDPSALAERHQLALALAARHISTKGLTPGLANALMRDPGPGGALVKLYLGARPEFLATDPSVFAAALVGCAVENHTWFDPLATQAAALATPVTRQDVLARTLAAVEAEQWPPDQQPRAKAMAVLLTTLFAAEIAALDPQAIRRLDRLDSIPQRLVAAILAAIRPDGAVLVDVGRLAQSADPDLRAVGIALVALRPIDALVDDLDTVAAFLTADASEPRLAARPIAARIARERPDAARALAEKLLPALYRSQEHEGLRDDLYGVLSSELRAGVVALGPDTVWTLLRARSEPARRLGAEIVSDFKPADFSIRQLARIGCNDQVKARRWAVTQLQVRIDDVRAAPQDGFALLDCSFEDSREAGYAMYRGDLKPEDWSPEALVALSDSITEPAQRFGREMIGRVFEAKNAEFLLSRLAEHPAAGFRLLVARLMRDYVQDDVQRLRRLVPAIETTLLQVRKSRAAKDQIFAFIQEQLQSDKHGTDGQRTAILAALLERSVATCATHDRARALSLLAAIKQTRPDLAPRAVFIPREARG